MEASLAFRGKEKKVVISGRSDPVNTVKDAVEGCLASLHSEVFVEQRPGITADLFKDEEDTPAMTIAVLEKKHRCVIDIVDCTKSVKRYLILIPEFCNHHLNVCSNAKLLCSCCLLHLLQ